MSAATEVGGTAAWMVDCGNTNIAEGDVRFWRAERKYEAHGCALAHGTKAVPLYARLTAPSDEVEALRAEVERLKAQAVEAAAAIQRHVTVSTAFAQQATAAEAALEKARDCLRAADAAILELSVTAGVIARGNNRGIADFDRQAGAARGFIAAALTPTNGGPHDDR